MRTPHVLDVKARLMIALALAGWLTVLACSVNVKKNDGEKKVDINTPFGGIHVDKSADARETGLPVYPGAQVRAKGKDDDDDDKQANVDISGFGYGLKVVAIEYQSSDAPDKVIAYYREHLRSFGTVLECRSSGHNYSMRPNGESKGLTCDSGKGEGVELKVGTRDDQHIVSIDPDGKGSRFALVSVQMNNGSTI
jgi:hypothetical protein